MSRVRHLVAMITALLASLNPTLACSCGRETLEERYCTRDYAIEAKILSREIVDENMWVRVYEYEIELLNNFKTSPEFDSAHLVVQAIDNGELCGVELSVGNTYLLMGSFERDRRPHPSEQSVLGTNSCDGNRKLSSTTEAGNVMAFLDDDNFHCEN